MLSKKSLMVLILIMVFSLFGISQTACSGAGVEEPAGENLAEPPQEEQFEETNPQLPENAALWDFSDGAPSGWDYSPGWQFENGLAVSVDPEQVMYTVDQWANFNLFAGVELEPESILSIHFRAGPERRYQVVIEPGFIILIEESNGEITELYQAKASFKAGWHELNLTVEGGYVSLMVDNNHMFEFEGLTHLERGSFVIVNLGQSRIGIDYFEVHNFDQQEIEMAAIEGMIIKPVIRKPPVAELFFVEQLENNRVRLIGNPGAVASGSWVTIANLETARVYFLDAEADGSFQIDIFAFPGSTIQIKHSHPDFLEDEPRTMLMEAQEFGEVILEGHNATTGTIIRVPDHHEPQPGEIPVFVAGSAGAGVDAYWHFAGKIIPINTSPQGMSLQVQGNLFFYSGQLSEFGGPPPESGIQFSLVRHFDESGDQRVIRKYMVSDHLSPTGFPIFHGEIPGKTIEGVSRVEDWQRVDDNTLVSEINIEIRNWQGIPITAGYYGLWIEPVGMEGGSYALAEGFTMRSGVHFGPGGQYSPVFRLGNPEQPRLFWGLLTDTLFEATRGTIARKDQTRISLLSLISQQSTKFIIPKDDPKTGLPLNYRLEPFLPLIDYSDRGIPAPPIIDFSFPSGELLVTVRRPDGGVDVLGPAPFKQSLNATPSYDSGKVLDYSIGGGALQEVYQLTTLDEIFNYTFDQYGHYVIEMTGMIEDIRGTTYSGGGIYDLYVARPLKLYNGVLPSTPFIEGDTFSPSLQVYPRMPVEIDGRILILPNSSEDRAIDLSITGKANRYGYFFPQEFEPITFPDGGEYRVDLTAQYTDDQGVLWMGSATWGNVIENQDTRLIAHGLRGLSPQVTTKLWYFHQQLDIESGIYHTFFPYYSGDIFWGHDDPREDTQVNGADAIMPGISLEDTSGEIYPIIKQNWETKSHAMFDIPEEGIEAHFEVDEARPFSTTSTGWDLSWFPELINQYGYVYQSSERPGARVHESLTEGIIPIGYWRYVGTYGDQVGVEGDLPNDIKWQFGGVVFRDLDRGIHDYAAYGSFWVLLPDDDPIGARVTPPFQGATGGPNGGPIMTLKGEEIDLLYLPRSGFPGQILETGDVLSFSGFVGPPLDSNLIISVTSPSGQSRVISGQANKIGYFYQPEDDFIVNEPGVWIIDIEVMHTGLTSSGPTMEPYPVGGVLGTTEGIFQIYVVDKGDQRVEMTNPGPGYLTISTVPIPPIEFHGRLPGDFENASYNYTISMPGFILEQGEGNLEGLQFNLPYDPTRLHEDFPNLDLTAYDELRPGLADQIWIAVLFESKGQYLPLTITLHGEEVFDR